MQQHFLKPAVGAWASAARTAQVKHQIYIPVSRVFAHRNVHPCQKVPVPFSKVSAPPCSQRFQPFPRGSSTILPEVSKPPFLKGFHPFPKGSITTFPKVFNLFPKVPIHGITLQAQGKSCPLLTRDVAKFDIWALLFCIACLT